MLQCTYDVVRRGRGECTVAQKRGTRDVEYVRLLGYDAGNVRRVNFRIYIIN